MRFGRDSAVILTVFACFGGRAFAASSIPPAAAPTATPDPLEEVIATGVPLPLPSLAAALRALHGGKAEEAAKDFQRLRVAGTLGPTIGVESAGEGHFLSGRAWLAAGKPELAVIPLRQAARDYDALPDYALFHLGEAYLALDRGNAAVDSYERLLVDYPQSVLAARTRLRLADALTKEKQFDRALELYQQAMEAGNTGAPQDELLLRIADAYSGAGKKDDAAATYFRIWRDHPVGEPAIMADAALDTLEAAGTKVQNRTAPEIRYKRALAMADAGKPADAVGEIDAIVRAISKGAKPGTSVKLPGDWRLKRALLLFRARKYDDARKEFESLQTTLPAGPERAEAMYWYARSLARGNDYTAARKEYDKMRAAFPRLSFARDALFKEGLMALEEKDFASSAKLFESYAKTYPTANDSDEALWYQAWSMFRAKKYVAANAAFRSLIEKHPKSQLVDRARYWTGRSQLLAGDKERGIETLSALALEQQLTYYGLLGAGALADAGVDVPLTSTSDGTAEIDPVDLGDESPDPVEAAATDLPPDVLDMSATSPGAAYRFHFGRARTLVRLGWQSEAAAELAAARGAARTKPEKLDLARLALAADYYHGAQTIARLAFGDELSKSKGDGEIVRLAYPKAWPRFVTAYAGQYRYSPSVLWAIMREESTYRPDVVSPVGAIGLLQIMPKTGAQIAEKLGVKGFTADRLFDPEINIGFSAWYVRDLLARYGGNEALAIASYNAGPDAVDRWLKQRGDLALDEFVEEIPFTETRRYVKRVLMSYGIYEALYGAGAPKIRAAHTVARATLVGATATTAALPATVTGTAGTGTVSSDAGGAAGAAAAGAPGP